MNRLVLFSFLMTNEKGWKDVTYPDSFNCLLQKLLVCHLTAGRLNPPIRDVDDHIMDLDMGKIITSEANKWKHWMKGATEIRSRASSTLTRDKGAHTLSHTRDLLRHFDHPRQERRDQFYGLWLDRRVSQLLNDTSAACQMTLRMKTGVTVKTDRAGNIFTSRRLLTSCWLWI